MENQNYRGANPEASAANVDESDGEVGVKEKFVSDDSTKIKFTNAANNFADGKNGDAKVDIENVQVFAGLSKEELMKYANDPFWIRLRMSLFVLFWILWVAMLVGAVIIILVTPRCPPPPTLEWWQKSPIYQVEVGSFHDSNGDGTGDIKGLVSKLDYLKDLGIESLLISPIFPSDGNEYEVTSFEGIDSKYGTLEEFEDLIKAMNARDMKLILEFVPNHSSLKHPWFINSSSDKTGPYANYYTWKNQPNNWKNIAGGSAWDFIQQRQEYYYHQFSSSAPDLNYADKKVREEILNVMRIWLDKGVSGFKIDHAAYLMEDEKGESSGDNSGTKNQPQTFELLREWREFLKNYSSSTETEPKILLTEVYDTTDITTKYYGTPSEPIANLALNFQLFNLKSDLNASDLLNSVVSVENKTDEFWQNFVLGNSDAGHLASRVGTDYLDAFHMFTLMAPGTPVILNGDEVGLAEGNPVTAPITKKADVSVASKMDWSLVDAQENGTSHLGVFKKLTELRTKQAIRLGSAKYSVLNGDVFTMTRVRKGTPAYLVAINFSHSSTKVDLTKACSTVPEMGHLELVSSNSQRVTNVKLKLTDVTLSPKEAILVQYVAVLE